MDPYTAYQQLLAQSQKQAVDALVPGQVGAGPNPGTTGSMDSNPAMATNTQIALQRAAQGAAPIMQNPSADGGAGWSNPAPGTSPSLQMFADVKAAAIENEAREFANAWYLEVKGAAGAVDAPFPGQVAKEAMNAGQPTAAAMAAGAPVPALPLAAQGAANAKQLALIRAQQLAAQYPMDAAQVGAGALFGKAAHDVAAERQAILEALYQEGTAFKAAGFQVS